MSDENISADGLEPTPTDEVGESLDAAEEVEGFLGTPWNRRTFLKAAALGTAAAAVFQKGPGWTLSPAAAYANDLSRNPCTANDTFISGSGSVLNEPCNPTTDCTDGTFTALVAFPVHNGTGTERYCIAIHIPDGFGVPAQDVILKTGHTGNTLTGTSTVATGDSTMYGLITGFPCNFAGSSLECFGANTSGDSRGKCDAGQCVTIAWNTDQGSADCTSADQKPAGGQCRHQQICVQRAQASLTCKTNCTPTCGQTTTLTAAIAGLTGPYVYQLYSISGNTSTLVATFPTSGTTTDTSHDFAGLAAGTYKVKVTGAGGCFRESGTVVVPAPTAITVSMASNASTSCVASGNVTFTANVSGDSGCTAHYAWEVDGASVGSDSSTYSYPPNADNTNHTVKVTVTCGSCTACAQRTVKQCVTTDDGDSGACP